MPIINLLRSGSAASLQLSTANGKSNARPLERILDFSTFFIRRLEGFGSLPEADKALIQSLTRVTDQKPPNSDIIREGDIASNVTLFATGFAYRYKCLANGRRQIVGFLMPGDTCNLHVDLPEALDHCISTLTEAQVVWINPNSFRLLLERPAISRALLLMSLDGEATSRDWVINIGSRPAEQRIAHFLCEWHARMQALQLVHRDECDFPLTQLHVSEATGLSPVHVNRVIKRLRDRELVDLKSKRLHILNVDKLRAFGKFTENHLQGR